MWFCYNDWMLWVRLNLFVYDWVILIFDFEIFFLIFMWYRNGFDILFCNFVSSTKQIGFPLPTLCRKMTRLPELLHTIILVKFCCFHSEFWRQSCNCSASFISSWHVGTSACFQDVICLCSPCLLDPNLQHDFHFFFPAHTIHSNFHTNTATRI